MVNYTCWRENLVPIFDIFFLHLYRINIFINAQNFRCHIQCLSTETIYIQRSINCSSHMYMNYPSVQKQVEYQVEQSSSQMVPQMVPGCSYVMLSLIQPQILVNLKYENKTILLKNKTKLWECYLRLRRWYKKIYKY